MSLRSCSASRARLVSFSLAPFPLIFLPPYGNRSWHQSRHEIAKETLDSLHFGITPARSLLVFSPYARLDDHHQSRATAFYLEATRDVSSLVVVVASTFGGAREARCMV